MNTLVSIRIIFSDLCGYAAHPLNAGQLIKGIHSNVKLTHLQLLLRHWLNELTCPGSRYTLVWVPPTRTSQIIRFLVHGPVVVVVLVHPCSEAGSLSQKDPSICLVVLAPPMKLEIEHPSVYRPSGLRLAPLRMSLYQIFLNTYLVLGLLWCKSLYQ